MNVPGRGRNSAQTQRLAHAVGDRMARGPVAGGHDSGEAKRKGVLARQT